MKTFAEGVLCNAVHGNDHLLGVQMRGDLRHDEDVFGRALLDWAKGSLTPEVLEREDGFTQIGAGSEVYLSEFSDWPSAERASIRHMRGRVVDVGCGAGRVALDLQRRGMDVVGVDTSPRAVKAARIRGVNEVWCLSAERLMSKIRDFDTIVLFGNNFGIFGTPQGAREILTEMARCSKPGAQIFVESTNSYCGGAPGFDRSYYHKNKGLGRAPGQARFRFRYDDMIGPWFNWLYVSRQEMRAILRGTGWHQRVVLGTQSSEPYVAVLEKD
ncbi:MAG TPA: class I SAM-dependent methyltransferase [Acidimicrobiales bacterium]|nr:class I SAM-dependent methyltransferase [Acidimicrobiales bacterium]